MADITGLVINGDVLKMNSSSGGGGSAEGILISQQELIDNQIMTVISNNENNPTDLLSKPTIDKEAWGLFVEIFSSYIKITNDCSLYLGYQDVNDGNEFQKGIIAFDIKIDLEKLFNYINAKLNTNFSLNDYTLLTEWNGGNQWEPYLVYALADGYGKCDAGCINKNLNHGEKYISYNYELYSLDWHSVGGPICRLLNHQYYLQKKTK